MRNRNVTIFFIVDTSGDMKPPMMDILNNEMEEMLNIFKTLIPSCDVSIAVLEFNSEVNWVLQPTPISNVKWEPLCSGGLCNFGAGIDELERNLYDFLGEDENNTTQNYYPIFIFMLAGHQTDDYVKPLKKIKNNLWFNKGVKIVFALSKAPDISALKDITGTSEAIITISDLNSSKKLFCLVEIDKKISDS